MDGFIGFQEPTGFLYASHLDGAIVFGRGAVLGTFGKHCRVREEFHLQLHSLLHNIGNRESLIVEVVYGLVYGILQLLGRHSSLGNAKGEQLPEGVVSGRESGREFVDGKQNIGRGCFISTKRSNLYASISL